MLIMANGPKHATTYRLYKAKSEMATYNNSDLPDLLDNRLGIEEIKTPGTRARSKKAKPTFKRILCALTTADARCLYGRAAQLARAESHQEYLVDSVRSIAVRPQLCLHQPQLF